MKENKIKRRILALVLVAVLTLSTAYSSGMFSNPSGVKEADATVVGTSVGVNETEQAEAITSENIDVTSIELSADDFIITKGKKYEFNDYTGWQLMTAGSEDNNAYLINLDYFKDDEESSKEIAGLHPQVMKDSQFNQVLYYVYNSYGYKKAQKTIDDVLEKAGAESKTDKIALSELVVAAGYSKYIQGKNVDDESIESILDTIEGLDAPKKYYPVILSNNSGKAQIAIIASINAEDYVTVPALTSTEATSVESAEATSEVATSEEGSSVEITSSEENATEVTTEIATSEEVTESTSEDTTSEETTEESTEQATEDEIAAENTGEVVEEENTESTSESLLDRLKNVFGDKKEDELQAGWSVSDYDNEITNRAKEVFVAQYNGGKVTTAATQVSSLKTQQRTNQNNGYTFYPHVSSAPTPEGSTGNGKTGHGKGTGWEDHHYYDDANHATNCEISKDATYWDAAAGLKWRYSDVGVYRAADKSLKHVDCVMEIVGVSGTNGRGMKHKSVYPKKDKIGVIVCGVDIINLKFSWYETGTDKSINVKGFTTFKDVDVMQGIEFVSGFDAKYVLAQACNGTNKDGNSSKNSNNVKSDVDWLAAGTLDGHPYIFSQYSTSLDSGNKHGQIGVAFSGTSVNCKFSFCKMAYDYVDDNDNHVKDSFKSGNTTVKLPKGIDGTAYSRAYSTGFMGFEYEAAPSPEPPTISKTINDLTSTSVKTGASVGNAMNTPINFIVKYHLYQETTGSFPSNVVFYDNGMDAKYTVDSHALCVGNTSTPVAAGIFTAAQSGNNITYTMSDAARTDENSYDKDYYLVIKAHLNPGATPTSTWSATNTAGVTYNGTNYGSNTVTHTANITASAKVKKLYHDLDSDTDKPLPGAKFRLWQWNGSAYVGVRDGVSGADGNVAWGTDVVVPNATNGGNFAITEVEAPKGYKLDTGWCYVFNAWNGKWELYNKATTSASGISALGEKSKEGNLGQNVNNLVFDAGTITDPPEEGEPESVKVLKKSRETGEGLSGAIFTLYKFNHDTNAWTKVTDLVEDEKDKGLYYNKNEFYYDFKTDGRWKVVETKAPDGTINESWSQEFKWQGEDLGENKPIFEVIVTNPMPTGNLHIVKTDAETAEKLKDIGFKIVAAEDIVTAWGTTLYEKGTTLGTFITDENGEATYSGTEVYSADLAKTLKDGKANADKDVEEYFNKWVADAKQPESEVIKNCKLYAGKYELVEVKTDDWHFLKDGTIPFEFENPSDQTIKEMENTLDVDNPRVHPSFAIAKIADKTTGAIFNEKTGRYDGKKESGTYLPEQTVTYSIKVTNTGDVPLTDLKLTDQMSDELEKYVDVETGTFVIPEELKTVKGAVIKATITEPEKTKEDVAKEKASTSKDSKSDDKSTTESDSKSTDKTESTTESKSEDKTTTTKSEDKISLTADEATDDKTKTDADKDKTDADKDKTDETTVVDKTKTGEEGELIYPSNKKSYIVFDELAVGDTVEVQYTVQIKYDYKVDEKDKDVLDNVIHAVATYKSITVNTPNDNDKILIEDPDPKFAIAKLADRTTGVTFDKVTGRYIGTKLVGLYMYKETVKFLVTITNTGNTKLTDFVVTDTMSDELTSHVVEGTADFYVPTSEFQTVLGSTTTVTKVANNVLNIDHLDIGDQISIVYNITVDQAQAMTNLKNFVHAEAKFHDKKIETPDDDDSITLEDPNPQLVVAKLADKTKGVKFNKETGQYEGKKKIGTYEANEWVTYKVTATNLGNVDLTNVTLTDEMSDELLEYVQKKTAKFVVPASNRKQTTNGFVTGITVNSPTEIVLEKLPRGDSISFDFKVKTKKKISDTGKKLDNVIYGTGYFYDTPVDAPEDDDLITVIGNPPAIKTGDAISIFMGLIILVSGGFLIWYYRRRKHLGV